MSSVKLSKSSSDKQISGVIGGLSKHLNLDSNLLRILYVLLTIFSVGVPTILIYIVVALILPYDTELVRDMDTSSSNVNSNVSSVSGEDVVRQSESTVDSDSAEQNSSTVDLKK